MPRYHRRRCHGAPGLPALIAAAIEADGDADGALLEAARRAGEVVWERGVILKGNGLCHGVAGNGYAFLSLHRLTGEPEQLERARAFAALLEEPALPEAISRQPDPQRRVRGKPDSPLSLMEGAAGVLCYLLDVHRAAQGASDAEGFPGWEI